MRTGVGAAHAALVVGGALAALLVVEGLLRLCPALAGPLSTPAEKIYFARYDPELGWAPRPLVTGIHRDDGFSVFVSENAWGLRAAADVGPARRVAGRRRILVLGDSYVWGYGAAQHELFTDPAVAGDGVDLVNFGVSGYGTDQELLLSPSRHALRRRRGGARVHALQRRREQPRARAVRLSEALLHPRRGRRAHAPPRAPARVPPGRGGRGAPRRQPGDQPADRREPQGPQRAAARLRGAARRGRGARPAARAGRRHRARPRGACADDGAHPHAAQRGAGTRRRVLGGLRALQAAHRGRRPREPPLRAPARLGALRRAHPVLRALLALPRGVARRPPALQRPRQPLQRRGPPGLRPRVRRSRGSRRDARPLPAPGRAGLARSEVVAPGLEPGASCM